MKLAALCLSAVLLLSGCGGGGDKSSTVKSGGSESGSSADVSSSAQQTGDQEVTDYTKYNTYLDLLSSLYDTTDILDVYFSVVEYQDEFQLIDGQDFSNRDLSNALVFGNLSFNIYLDNALEMTGEAPSYEELDPIVTALVPAAKELNEVLDELKDYISDETWQSDDYAGAAEIHSRLIAASDVFLDNLLQMDDCINRMEDELNEQALDQMLQDGEMIGYYTMVAIQQDEKLVNLVYDEGNYAEDGLYIQNLDEITAANEELKQTLDSLLEALNDKDERAKVSRINYSTESSREYNGYTDFLYRIDTVNQRLADLLENAGDECSYKAELVANGYSDLVYCYNTYVVG